MKLANKIIILVSASVVIALLTSSWIFYSESKKAMVAGGVEKAKAVIKTFDFTLKDNETDESMQGYLNKMKQAADLEVLEFVIYRLGDDPKAIASTDPATVGKKADPEDVKAAKEDSLVPIVNGNIIDVTTTLHSKGEVAYVAGIKFSILNELDALQNVLKITTFTSLILLLIVVALIWFLVNRYLSRPLKTLVLISEKMADGDLRFDVKGNDHMGKDEIGILTRSFFNMAIHLRSLVVKISNSSDQLASNAKKFLLISNQISHQSGQTEKEIAASIDEIAQGAKNQLTSLNETFVAIDEMVKGIGFIATSTEEVSVSTSSSLRKAESGNRIINETLLIMENLVSQSKDSASKIALLGEKTKEIDQIIEVIAQISKQTNLLALNASIEAARAGEHGRGFAVVANEVKKLAEQSRSASENVSEMVRSVQYETEQVIIQINQSSEKTLGGLAAVRNAGVSFEQISDEVVMISKQVVNVSAIAEEMSASSEEISASMQTMVHAVEISSHKAETVAEATVQSLASMQELLGSSHNLSQLSEELNKLISNFKLKD